MKKLFITTLVILLLYATLAFGGATKLHTGQDIIEPGVSIHRVIDALGEPMTKRYIGKNYNAPNLQGTERIVEIWTYNIRGWYYHIYIEGNTVILVDDERQ